MQSLFWLQFVGNIYTYFQLFLLQDTVVHIQRTEKHAPKEFSIRSKSITNPIVTSWATKIALLSSIWWQTGIMELSQVKVHIPDSICVFVLFSKNTLRKIPKRKNCKWKTNIPRQSCAVCTTVQSQIVEYHAWNWAEKFGNNFVCELFISRPTLQILFNEKIYSL